MRYSMCAVTSGYIVSSVTTMCVSSVNTDQCIQLYTFGRRECSNVLPREIKSYDVKKKKTLFSTQ